MAVLPILAILNIPVQDPVAGRVQTRAGGV
jgi:hypothetical protein